MSFRVLLHNRSEKQWHTEQWPIRTKVKLLQHNRLDAMSLVSVFRNVSKPTRRATYDQVATWILMFIVPSRKCDVRDSLSHVVTIIWTLFPLRAWWYLWTTPNIFEDPV